MIFHDFSNFKFVTEIGPEKGDAPTFKKCYSKVQFFSDTQKCKF